MKLKKTLASWKESFDKPRQCLKKQRHHIADKGPYSQSYSFPVVVYRYACWTIKKAEHQRTDAFKVWCRRRLLRVPWTARRSYQSILKESPLDHKEIKPVNPKGNQSWIFIGRTDAEAETPILWPSDAKKWLIGKKGWCWERLKAGGKRAYKGWDGWMALSTQWRWVWVNSRSWWWTGRPGVLQSLGLQRVGYDWATELKKVNLKGSLHKKK